MTLGKNKYGQYFTKDTISDFMVSLITHDKSVAVMEPSAGEGVFLKSLIKSGFSNLTAFEIDATLDNPYEFVEYRSFLSVPTSQKYDVVIGNPPYIRWKNLEKELKDELSNNDLWNQYFNSLCDYLFIFILKSIEHLTDEGELIFICSEYWLNTTNSQTLRDYIMHEGYISDIYHFKEAPLFEKVTASLIIFRFVKGKMHDRQINLYKYSQKGMPTLSELLNLKCFTQEIIPQFQCGEKWILATEEKQKKLKQFEYKCSYVTDLFNNKDIHTIGDFCNIGNGMVSGLDRAFKIPDGIELTPYENKNSIKVLKAKDLNSYYCNQYSRYIMVQDQMSENEFCRKCPNFAKLLYPYISELNNRYNYNRNIPYWEFVFPRNLKLFSRKCDKIFVPCKERISHRSYFRFCIAEEGVFPLQDVTGLVRKDSCKESIEYILAFLNTPIVFEWLSINGIVKGAIVEFSEAPLASIPFRAIDWNSREEVNTHDKITMNVREFLNDRDEIHIQKINILFKDLMQ